MADKQIVELPTVSAVTDDMLIPVYAPGSTEPAQKMTGKQLRAFGEAAVPAGASVFEQAVNAGYTGTEAEFYAALVTLKNAPFLPLAGGTVTGEICLPTNSFPLKFGTFTAIGTNSDLGTDLVLSAAMGYVVIDAEFGLRWEEYGGPNMSAEKFASDNISDNMFAPKGYVKYYVDMQRPKLVPVTLTAAGWSDNAQTVTVSGVSADETAQLIQPRPSIASQAAYIEAGILCTGQSANSLTFTAETTPTENLTVYVIITKVTQ